MINSEAATLSSHAHDLVNHVHLIFGDFCSLELFNNNVCHGLILTVVDIQNTSFGTSTIFLSFYSLLVFVNILMSFHITVDIFINNVMTFFVVDLGLTISCCTKSTRNRQTLCTRVGASRSRPLLLVGCCAQMFKLLTHSLLSLNLIFIIQN